MRSILRRHSWPLAQRDLWAGLTVALFTIPQAMAYALIAGAPPAAGIATAVVASIVGALFGSSAFLINGPTNAISVMLASNLAILATHGDPHRMVIVLTLMIGVFQLLAALLKAGTLTRFISEPVLVGFTAGAGVYVAVNQLPAALGLEKSKLVPQLFGWKPPGDALFDFVRTLWSASAANYQAIALALATFLVVRVLQSAFAKSKSRVPAPFLTVVAVSLAAYLLGPLDVKVVKDMEPITRALPQVAIPSADWTQLSAMVPSALAIGLLGAVEAIAIAKALASKAGHRFSSNTQLVGEGACNLAAGLVGGFAASGSFTRTAVNFESGAATKFSAVISGVLVMAIVLAFAPLANYIPIAVLAGMLIHVGTKLVNVSKLRLIMQTTVYDRRAAIWTFFAVLLLPDLVYALFLGVGLSVFGALRRAEGFKLLRLVDDGEGHLVEESLNGRAVGEVITLDLQGELFFAAAEEIEARLRAIFNEGPRFIVLRLQQAYNMDLTCAEAVTSVAEAARAKGGRLILSGVRPGMRGTLQRAGALDKIGEDAIFDHESTLLGSTRRAIDYANELAVAGETSAARAP